MRERSLGSHGAIAELLETAPEDVIAHMASAICGNEVPQPLPA